MAGGLFWTSVREALARGLTDKFVAFDDYWAASKRLKGLGAMREPQFDLNFDEEEGGQEESEAVL
jgi:hypothetical protein